MQGGSLRLEPWEESDNPRTSTEFGSEIDYSGDGRPSSEEGRVEYKAEVPELPFAPDDADQSVDDFETLEWLIIAEALNAWHADLHLGRAYEPPRGGNRWEELQSAVVREAGVETEDILPVVRERYEAASDEVP